MNYRKLCTDGPEVSEIGLGTWALGSPVYGTVEGDAADAVVGKAIDDGINFFDTAPLYGTPDEDGVAEVRLGRALGRHRDSVVISTKFGRTARAVMPGRFNAEELTLSCEASLKRLGREHIDLLFFHSPFTPEEISDSVWEALSRLKRSGKVRFVGHSVSMYSDTAEMSARWMRQGLIDVVQVVLSPFNREARPLIATALETGCGVVARECLANGFLSGQITSETHFPEGSLNARYDREEIRARADYANRLQALFAKGGVPDLVEGTYRWVLDQSGVTLALSGAKEAQELQGPVNASSLPAFDSAIQEEAERIHKADFSAA
jgi:aryl-alcohol dehydrogenase-like predicted oxidoreductase